MYDSDLVEYTISVEVPEDMRTRATQEGGINPETGLYEYPQKEINRLRYAIYQDNSLVISNKDDLIRSNSEPFIISLKFDTYIDPTTLNIFFWADNAKDDYYIINYEDKSIKFRYNPNLLDNNTQPKDIGYKDAFTGFFQFAQSLEELKSNKTFILKRPFAEIHVLSDEFDYTDDGIFYKNGVRTYYGFGDEKATYKNCKEQMYLPQSCNFSCEIESDRYGFTSFPATYWGNFMTFYPSFYNYLNYTDSKHVSTNYKNRKMEYITCFYMWTPLNGFHYLKDKDSIKKLDKINLCLNEANYVFAQDYVKFITLDFPEEGLKPNHKYIYYNKPFEEGGTGFLGGTFSYDILVDADQDWEESSSEQEAA